jgi:hypothetical protein
MEDIIVGEVEHIFFVCQQIQGIANGRRNVNIIPEEIGKIDLQIFYPVVRDLLQEILDGLSGRSVGGIVRYIICPILMCLGDHALDRIEYIPGFIE